MPKISLTAAVDVTVVSKLAEEAQRRGVKLSRLVNEALAAWVERNKQKSKQKSGRVVTVRPDSQKGGDNDDHSTT